MTLKRKQKELRRLSGFLASRGSWWATYCHSWDWGGGKAWRKIPGVCEPAGGHAWCTAGCAHLELRGAFWINGYILELSAYRRLDLQGALFLPTLHNENTEAEGVLKIHLNVAGREQSRSRTKRARPPKVGMARSVEPRF